MTRPERPAVAGPVDVGLRPNPGLDLSAPLPPGDPDLVARIRDEIASSGPMTFARFMELALYDPRGGYYVRVPDEAGEAATGPGRAGDFLTAPEGHPIFGWAIARHLESASEAIGRPARFVVREHGAGTGALAAGILDGLRRSGSELARAIRYQALEASPGRLAVLQARLGAAGLASYLEPADDRPEAGAILANELLDALPVHRVEGGPAGELLERYVADADGRLHEVPGLPSTPDLAARLAAEGIRLLPGQVAEVGLALDRWVEAAAAPLAAGVLLVIDYGHPAGALYDPDRGPTLRAYHRHRVHADPFAAIGRQDLTAHVDLTALERAAAAAGMEPLGATTQARFLEALGAGELLVGLQAAPGTTLASYLEAKSALVRMLDPRATGGFAVRAFGRGVPGGAPLRGFGAAR